MTAERERNVKSEQIGVATCDLKIKEEEEAAAASMAEQQEYEYEIQEAEEEEEAVGKQIIAEEDKLVLEFMDSTHDYLSLLHSLSSTLSQGWMDLACARLSMGSSRINTRLLHLNPHSAPTTFHISNHHHGAQPRFTLRKWVSSSQSDELKDDENENVQPQDKLTIAKNFSGPANDDEVRKERSKSLSVFGILISPKLRDTQLSFEKALETLVEIANMKSSLLYSFHQLRQDAEDTKE